VKVLLDTNAYTALFRGHEGVAEHVRRADQLLLSAVVAGELLFGFRNGSRYEANRRELDEFLSSPYVELLPVTFVTADRFGRIAAALRRKGRPIPTNDIWIAAHAMESGAELLSFDEHFEQVDGLAWSKL
jgi:tRNA(fMet)-specific endonuclease VapC